MENGVNKPLKIAVVNSSSFGKWFPEHIKRLEALGTVESVRVAGDAHGKELAESLSPYNVIIASVTPFFDAEFFAHKTDVLLISRHGIGYNNVDIEAAKKTGTTVTTVEPLVERDAVAECAVACLMSNMRMVAESRQAANEGKWSTRARFLGRGLSGKTVGIIGCGNIGTRVAEILSRGFDMRVIACDPVPRPEWAEKMGVNYVSLEELARTSDIIALHANLTPDSYHILDEKILSLVKPGVYVEDNARADLIDQEAMLKALDDGRVAGLAIDVMHDEPPLENDPYFNHPKVLVTTHIGAYTRECLVSMGEKCVSDVERYAQGLPAVHAIYEAK